MRNIFTIAYSREEANEIGHFLMENGYEGIVNDSYRYCDLLIQGRLMDNNRHNRNYIYVGCAGRSMIVGGNKRGLRRNGLKYIEKKRVFLNIIDNLYKERCLQHHVS